MSRLKCERWMSCEGILSSVSSPVQGWACETNLGLEKDHVATCRCWILNYASIMTRSGNAGDSHSVRAISKQSNRECHCAWRTIDQVWSCYDCCRPLCQRAIVRYVTVTGARQFRSQYWRSECFDCSGVKRDVQSTAPANESDSLKIHICSYFKIGHWYVCVLKMYGHVWTMYVLVWPYMYAYYIM